MKEHFANCQNCGHMVSFQIKIERPTKNYLEEILDNAKAELFLHHIEAARKSQNIFQSTKLIQQYYKFLHRIEVVTELLEEVEC